MKQLVVFVLPLDGMLVHRGSLPRSLLDFPKNSQVPIYTPGWMKALWELSVLPKNKTPCPRSGLESGLLTPGTSALTIIHYASHCDLYRDEFWNISDNHLMIAEDLRWLPEDCARSPSSPLSSSSSSSLLIPGEENTCKRYVHHYIARVDHNKINCVRVLNERGGGGLIEICVPSNISRLFEGKEHYHRLKKNSFRIPVTWVTDNRGKLIEIKKSTQYSAELQMNFINTRVKFLK